MGMGSSDFLSPDWYNALTLTERVDALWHSPCAPRGESNHESVRRRIDRWRGQAPFSQGSYFEQRLGQNGLTESQLLAIVGTPVERLRDGSAQAPPWLTVLERAFQDTNGPGDSRVEEADGVTLARLVDPVMPLVRDGRRRLVQRVRHLHEKCPQIPFDDGDVENMFHRTLWQRLADRTVRTLTLELHVARLQGFLEGNTPEARFQSFFTQLEASGRMLRLLREYPVLARELVMAVDHWLDFTVELLERLCTDWTDILETLASGHDPGPLMSCRSAGDDHHRGRHVVILQFRSGFQVVYKPRSLSLGSHLQRFLAWMNSRGQVPAFRTLRMLDRDGYGWVEFVSPRACESETEVGRFYERQGSYLAVLYLLGATDFHHENVIATGEDPVLIDLETLFHPSPPSEEQGAVSRTLSLMNASVMAVGLLPRRSWASGESDGVDLSGLGNAEGQALPRPMPRLEYVGTDQMRWTHGRVTLAGEHNRPTLNGADIDLQDYVEAIDAGFSRTYRLLLCHRAELFSTDGPLAWFTGDELRVIVRPTQTYGALLRESFHPDVLRDALDRERLFDRLWVPVVRQPYLSAVISAERHDLANGDIPMFTTRTDSRDLWTSNHERIPGFFSETGMATVTQRLAHFGTDDLDRQRWFIRASLATLDPRVDRAVTTVARSSDSTGSAERDRLLKAARVVGDRLGALAVRWQDEATWIGLAPGLRRLRVTPLNIDLYDGLPGVVLFLAYLGYVTGDSAYNDLARAALTAMRRQVDLSRHVLKNIGGFNGWGGVVYALSSLATLWNDTGLRDEAREVVEVIAPLIEDDIQLDVIGGAAGCLASVVSLYHAAPSERTLAIAARCGDHLLARAETMPAGIAWRIPAEARALTGFSHGAAGIAWALSSLADLTENNTYRSAALAAIEYERSLFSQENRNWPDLRVHEGIDPDAQQRPARFMNAWCHGAVGIGLARLLSLGRLDDPGLPSEISIALRTTLCEAPCQNHSLCHGELGNLDFVLQASEVLGNSDLHRHVYRRAASVLRDIERDGWACGLSAGVESPGLMTGLAGIGYQLLRLAEPTRVPSVLALALPLAE